jgi:AcrR family transcriptional regulator
MYDPDKYHAKRTRPLQARGKERVRVILATALQLFKERGVDGVTTNDIAKQAGIPIGSLYRYYPNKEAIITALTELYADDIAKVFVDIRSHPLLPHLSWDEVLLLMVESWVNYSRLNGPFDFMYSQKADPRLSEQNRIIWGQFVATFASVIRRRCPDVSDRQVRVCFQLSLAAVELGVDTRNKEAELLYHDAVGATAAYMLRNCLKHEHIS